jgi:tetratricopeptide (TPR) repeat protein
MPGPPFDPIKDAPRREPAAVAASDHDRARRYTHRDIVAIYPSLRLDHLRYLEKCGLVKPLNSSGDRLYGFADLTVLRQIAGELQQGSPFRAVVRTLQSSRTGQLTFDFRLDAHPARILELKPRNAEALGSAEPGMQGTIPLTTLGTPGTIGTGAFGAISSAEQYFLMGSLLDDGTPERVEEAVKSYRRALEEDPDLVAALINLANIRYSRDELAEAQALYERAIALDDSYFEAHFNLGNIHHDHGHYAEAEASYRDALALNHHYADAHFYLAVTLEKMGRSIDARAHWKAYERLAPNGEWVELAREFSD